MALASFSNAYLFQALTAYENLELALRASGEKVVRDRIFEMLEKLGLSERAEHLPRRYPLVRSADWCSAVRFSPITMCCWRTSRRMTWMRNGRSASSRVVARLLCHRGRSVVLVTHDPLCLPRPTRYTFWKAESFGRR